MALLDGFVTLPASLYADLSADVGGFDGRFLFLQDIPDLPIDVDPLLVYRGEASFGTLGSFEVLNTEVNATTPGAGMLSWSSISTTPRVSIGLARRWRSKSQTPPLSTASSR